MNNNEIESRAKETGRIPESQLTFFKLMSHLSEVKRQGWVDRGINNPESVAEHSYMVAFMSTFEAKRRGLDIERTSMMALVHDLSEIYAGDITPYQHLPEDQRAEAILRWTPPSEEAIADKHKREEEALRKIIQRLPVEFRTSILELWKEYNEGQTLEAKLVHQMDHIQRLLQAKKYRDQDESFSMDSFLQQALQSEDPEERRQAKKIQKDISPQA